MSIRSTFKMAKIATIAGAAAMIDRDWSKRYLVDALTRGGPGLGPKFAQFLAMKLDVSAKPQPLPSMSVEFVRELIDHYVPRLASDLLNMDEKGVVASIGQVHRATLKDGRHIAIKIQRPGVQNAIESEMDAIFAAARLSPIASKSFDMDRWKTDLKAQLVLELDYLAEAARQQQFRQQLAGMKQVVVPEVLTEYSSREVLVQIWEDSQSFGIAAEWSEELRQRAMDLLTHVTLQSMFCHQHLHADFQPANLGMRLDGGSRVEDLRLVLYDFGSTLHLKDTDVGAITGLLSDARQKRFDRSLKWFSALGFSSDLLAQIGESLNELTRILVGPLVELKPLDPAEFSMADRLASFSENQRWAFRSSGPPWFLVLMRVFFGLLHAGKDLKTKIPIGEFLQLYLPMQFHAMNKTLESVRHIDFNRPSSQHLAENHRAEFLCVEVCRGNDVLVSLQMPAAAVERLHELVPESTALELQRRGQDLRQIGRDALENGLRPQELFRDQSGEKSYHVWLQ